jgi:hypothetical protein
MRLNEDRISHISHRILDGLIENELVEPVQSEEKVLREIKRTITAELQFEDEADTAARRMIQSLSRRVPEGSPEWDILYRKYMDEEIRRRKKI